MTALTTNLLNMFLVLGILAYTLDLISMVSIEQVDDDDDDEGRTNES